MVVGRWLEKQKGIGDRVGEKPKLSLILYVTICLIHGCARNARCPWDVLVDKQSILLDPSQPLGSQTLVAVAASLANLVAFQRAPGDSNVGQHGATPSDSI